MEEPHGDRSTPGLSLSPSRDPREGNKGCSEWSAGVVCDPVPAQRLCRGTKRCWHHGGRDGEVGGGLRSSVGPSPPSSTLGHCSLQGVRQAGAQKILGPAQSVAVNRAPPEQGKGDGAPSVPGVAVGSPVGLREALKGPRRKKGPPGPQKGWQKLMEPTEPFWGGAGAPEGRAERGEICS